MGEMADYYIDRMINRDPWHTRSRAYGMTINREAFARDAIVLAKELRQWRNAHERAQPQKAAEGGFAGAFGDLFKDLGKHGR